ncbi:MAG: hypothetical protein FWF37_02095 [Chloroflexi bacterium]|nr:hypothetical protein [Chloroflexota bacterium]
MEKTRKTSNRLGTPNKKRHPAHPQRQFELLSTNMWLSNQQIGEFFGWSGTKTTDEIKLMHNLIIERGKTPIRGYVATETVIEYYGLDLQKIFKAARQLLELEKMKTA